MAQYVNISELQIQNEPTPTDYISTIAKLIKELRLDIKLNKWYNTYVHCNKIKLKFLEQQFLLHEEFNTAKDIFITDITNLILCIILARLVELDHKLKLENCIQFNWHRNSVDTTKNEPIDQIDIGRIKNILQQLIADIICIKIEEFNSDINKSFEWYPINKYIQLKDDLEITNNIIHNETTQILINKNDYVFLNFIESKLTSLKEEISKDKGHYGWHMTFSKHKQIAEHFKKHKDGIKEELLQDKIKILHQQIIKVENDIMKRYMKAKIKPENIIKEANEFVSNYKNYIINFNRSSKDPQYKQLHTALSNLIMDLKQSKPKLLIKNLIETIEDLLSTLKRNADSNKFKISYNNQEFSSIDFLNKVKSYSKPNKSIQYERLKYEIEYFSIILEAFNEFKLNGIYQTIPILGDNTNKTSNELNYIIWSIEIFICIGNYLTTRRIDIDAESDCIFTKIKNQMFLLSNSEDTVVIHNSEEQEIEQEHTSSNKSEENEHKSSIYGSLINLQTLQEEMSDIHRYLKEYNESAHYNCDKEEYLKDLKSVENINELLVGNEQKNKLNLLKKIEERTYAIKERLTEFNGSNLEHEYYELDNDITFSLRELDALRCKGCPKLKEKRKYLMDVLKELASLYDEKCANGILAEDETELRLDSIKPIKDKLVEIIKEINNVDKKGNNSLELYYALMKLAAKIYALDDVNEHGIIEDDKKDILQKIEENKRLLFNKKH